MINKVSYLQFLWHSSRKVQENLHYLIIICIYYGRITSVNGVHSDLQSKNNEALHQAHFVLKWIECFLRIFQKSLRIFQKWCFFYMKIFKNLKTVACYSKRLTVWNASDERLRNKSRCHRFVKLAIETVHGHDMPIVKMLVQHLWTSSYHSRVNTASARQ